MKRKPTGLISTAVEIVLAPVFGLWERGLDIAPGATERQCDDALGCLTQVSRSSKWGQADLLLHAKRAKEWGEVNTNT